MANIINGTDTGSGGLITTGDSSDELQLQTAEVARVTLTNTAVVVNESGADVDFRVESDTVENALFVDGATGNVGIGTTSNNGDTGRTYLTIDNASGGGAISLFRNGGEACKIITDAENNLTLSADPGNSAGSSKILFAVDNTERALIDSSGYLRLAGGGIQFNGDTAAANALDDYEEGTWTTTFSAETNLTGTPSLSSATYTKIGRLVYIQGKVTGYSVTASNTLTGFVATLPINMATNTDPCSSGIYVAIFGVSCSGFTTDNSSGNATEIFIGLSSVNVLNTGTATFQISLTYIAA